MIGTLALKMVAILLAVAGIHRLTAMITMLVPLTLATPLVVVLIPLLNALILTPVNALIVTLLKDVYILI
jgi:uncharacterized protein (DUF697 family)